MTALDVVVVSANSARWLPGCLGSVLARAGDVELHVVVSDMASTDGSAELVERDFPAVRVLRCENRGFAHGNNEALRVTSSPFALLLNPDTEIVAGTLADAVAALAAQPQAGVLAVRQVSGTGELQPVLRRFPTVSRMLFDALGAERLPVRAPFLGERILEPAAYERPGECDWVQGSFMLLRRAALESAGLMDERFFLYCEETDLCLRLRQAGWRTRYEPVATVVHHEGPYGTDPRREAQHALSRRLYLEKHFGPVRRTAAIGTVALRLGLRAIGGGWDASERSDRRAASRRALRTLLGLAPPPFG